MVNLSPTVMSDTSANFIVSEAFKVAPTDVVEDDFFVVATVHSIALPSAWANCVFVVNVTTPGVGAARRDRRDTTTDLTVRVSWLFDLAEVCCTIVGVPVGVEVGAVVGAAVGWHVRSVDGVGAATSSSPAAHGVEHTRSVWGVLETWGAAISTSPAPHSRNG